MCTLYTHLVVKTTKMVIKITHLVVVKTTEVVVKTTKVVISGGWLPSYPGRSLGMRLVFETLSPRDC